MREGQNADDIFQAFSPLYRIECVDNVPSNPIQQLQEKSSICSHLNASLVAAANMILAQRTDKLNNFFFFM